MTRRPLPLLVAALAMLLVPVSTASAGPHPDADYSEAYFPANDGFGTNLHADILRPKGMPLDADHRTPVIMAVTPYGNHSGSTIDFDPFAEGPNERFYDFLNMSQILKQGYTYVQVDLPGFGGSGGCNDWGGYREQTAVKAAVEWAAHQDWSTGKVALLGKSYDGWTGLMGISQRPEGLAAVVSLEPVYAGYRYYYNNSVRFVNSLVTPALFQAIDAKPGTVNDTPQYHANGAPQAWCYGVNIAIGNIDDPNHVFWQERDLLISSRGEATPLLLTQGFLELNTKPDGAFDYWNGLDLTESRAWFTQFDHCRAWETSAACGRAGGGGGDRLAVGRDGFMDEVMRFLDEHLKGIEPAVEDPKIVVQDNRGLFRAETAWPPEDMALYWSDLNLGSYQDDGLANAGNQQIWSFSPPLEHDVWLAGEPTVKVQVDAPLPRANIVANVFDVAPDGRAVLINRGTSLLQSQGTQFATFELYGQDWRVAQGHRIGVVIAGTDAQRSTFWTHVPTGQEIDVLQARIGLPFLRWERTDYLDGGSTPRLEQHLESTIDVQPFIESGEREFNLPGPLVERATD